MIFLPQIAGVADLYYPSPGASKRESYVGEPTVHGFVIESDGRVCFIIPWPIPHFSETTFAGGTS
jgi:hypothetical protein